MVVVREVKVVLWPVCTLTSTDNVLGPELEVFQAQLEMGSEVGIQQASLPLWFVGSWSRGWFS